MPEKVQEIQDILAEHPFTHDLPEPEREKLARVAQLKTFAADEFLLREGRVSEMFYLIVAGRASVELYVPERGVLRLQTLGPGDAVGWSWMLPPYRANFDIRTLDTTEVIAFDAAQLRRMFDQDAYLGYQVARRLLAVVAERVRATRLQLLDMYAPPGGGQ